MRRVIVALMTLASCAVIGACSLFGPTTRVRVALEHSYASSLAVTAFVEGAEGRSLDAASVVLTVPSGDALLLRYDGASAAYKGIVPMAESGTYAIGVLSAKEGEEIVISVPLEPLSAQPAILSIQDSSGVSYAAGGQPSSAKTINVAWDAVPGASQYSLSCSRGGVAIYQATCSAPSSTIPAGALSAGSIAVVVEAQFISGDPLLRNSDFYSVSVSRSPSVLCAIAP